MLLKNIIVQGCREDLSTHQVRNIRDPILYCDRGRFFLFLRHISSYFNSMLITSTPNLELFRVSLRNQKRKSPELKFRILNNKLQWKWKSFLRRLLANKQYWLIQFFLIVRPLNKFNHLSTKQTKTKTRMITNFHWWQKQLQIYYTSYMLIWLEENTN